MRNEHAAHGLCLSANGRISVTSGRFHGERYCYMPFTDDCHPLTLRDKLSLYQIVLMSHYRC